MESGLFPSAICSLLKWNNIIWSDHCIHVLSTFIHARNFSLLTSTCIFVQCIDMIEGIILKINKSISDRLRFRSPQYSAYCIQFWICPVLFLPYRDLTLICPVLNLLTLNFSYIIITYNSSSPVLNSPSCQRAKINSDEISPINSISYTFMHVAKLECMIYQQGQL